MKRNFNRIIVIAIVASVLNVGMVPVFASDITQNPNIYEVVQAQANANTILTLDDAIKSAISISEILALDEKKISYTNKINDVNKQIDDDPQMVGKQEIPLPDNRKDLNDDTRDVKLKQCKQQRDFDEDKLIQNVTNAYNDLVTSQMRIAKLKKDIELKNEELNITKIKNSIGSATDVDVDASSNSLEDLKSKLKSSESSLKDLQYNFKVLTDKDLMKYSLDQNIKYGVFKIDGSIDEYLDNVVENYLKYSTQLVQLNKKYFNDSDNKVDDIPDSDKPSDAMPVLSTSTDDIAENLKAYEEYQGSLDKYYQERYMYAFKLSTRLGYLNGKLGTYEGETNLDETKKQFKEQLRNFYTMLTTTEDSINLLKKNIELTNKQLRIANVRYDTGLMTKVDYDHLVVNSKDLDIQLRSAIDRYNTLKEEIQKPWIAFSK
ncbi:TolC family protein [Clostridium sp. BL-8]|uniref:TolC family protein n=1 Tax=Clostridium sp. BL-8 TaxID=349938 RepID=UPI00098C13E0|nr:TolC family protein [Clostridium sp. BL-8]OOM78420.1 outer membrane efflux protein [Clostridium sp. BL-8]